ncbi:MAG: hypothetical protein GY791_04100 [Alphaproteobacteria bacterium]|nr:hypothetical protein [Alphaproteobacteria bacterium]
MTYKSTPIQASGVPPFAGVVTVPGEYFMPLVDAAVAVAAWCVRKTGALVRR